MSEQAPKNLDGISPIDVSDLPRRDQESMLASTDTSPSKYYQRQSTGGSISEIERRGSIRSVRRARSLDAKNPTASKMIREHLGSNSEEVLSELEESQKKLIAIRGLNKITGGNPHVIEGRRVDDGGFSVNATVFDGAARLETTNPDSNVKTRRSTEGPITKITRIGPEGQEYIAYSGNAQMATGVNQIVAGIASHNVLADAEKLRAEIDGLQGQVTRKIEN